MAEMSRSDTKLVQYLNEAYGKEKELETALQAHIAMTTRAPYRKRLQQHLTETKRHATAVQRRIKQLGGEPEVLPLPGPEAVSQAAGAAVELGSRAMAAAKGPLHAIRGTGEQEKMLKNAKTEYSEEHEEIATYQAIDTLASSLGDKATAQLARAIRREEERMASFLSRLIPTLTKAVVQEEVPASERRARSGGKRASTRRAGGKRSAAGKGSASKRSPATRRTTAKAAKAPGSTRSSAAKASSRPASSKGSKAASGAGSKRRSTAKAPSSRRTGAKAGAAKSGGAKASRARGAKR